MISCPNCGLDNLEGTQECWNCHASINLNDSNVNSNKSKDDSEILKEVTQYNTIEIHENKVNNNRQMAMQSIANDNQITKSQNYNQNQTNIEDYTKQTNNENYNRNVMPDNYNPNELIVNNDESYTQADTSNNDTYNQNSHYQDNNQKSLKSTITKTGLGMMGASLIFLAPMLLGVGKFSKFNLYELLNPANNTHGGLRFLVSFILFLFVILFIFGLACYFKTNLLASGIKVERKHTLIRVLSKLNMDKSIFREDEVTYYEAISYSNILMLLITPVVLAVGFYSLYTPVSAVMILEVILALISLIVTAIVILNPDTISFYLKKDVRDYEGFKQLVLIANIPTVALVIMIVIHVLL